MEVKRKQNASDNTYRGRNKKKYVEILVVNFLSEISKLSVHYPTHWFFIMLNIEFCDTN